MSPEEIELLKAENERLRAEAAKRKAKSDKHRKLGWGFLKRSSGMVLGAQLKGSVEKFLEELAREQRVSRETLSDLLSSILIRLTRVGFLLVVTAILPSLLLIFQTYYLARQNTLIEGQQRLFEQQNIRLDQQTYLQEADRRGSLVLLLDNLIKEVNDDVARNPSNTIDPATSGRLIALSKMLKPYRYLENDSLTAQVVSPERGYLLLSLIETDLNFKVSRSLSSSGSLLSRLDFSYAELREANILKTDLPLINLARADLRGSNFSGSDFESANFSGANLNHSRLNYVNFEKADLASAKMDGAILDYAVLTKADLSSADLRNASFLKTKIIDADLKNAQVSEGFERDVKGQLNVEQYAWLFGKYAVVEVEDGVWQLLLK